MTTAPKPTPSSSTPRSTERTPSAAAEPEVLVRHVGTILGITLNRPRAINAFNRDMAETVIDAVEGAENFGVTAIVLDGAGPRGFCGGGDIKAMSSGTVDDAIAFLRTEYIADYRVGTSRVPVVGIMDGITMGGGIGLTGHADVRVVTERSRLAMPEARIGIAPDVGGHLLLARAPGRLGELLAVTSASMTAGDAIALGFADHFVPSEKLEGLRAALAVGEDPATAVRQAAAPVPDSELARARAWFDPIADEALGAAHEPGAAQDPAGAAQRLLAALESSEHAEARTAADEMRSVCPTSVAVTLAQIDRTRRESLDLAAVLTDDLRVLGRLVARPDFREGVRAQVIDKDGAPRWVPASIDALNREELSAVLAPFTRDERPLKL